MSGTRERPAARARATLAKLRAAGLHRRRRTIETAQGPTVTVDGRTALLMCSNDYLGLAGHPALREAAANAALEWGAGAGASALVSGHMAPHEALEEELADFKGAPACVLFGSGYLANTGVIAAVTGPGDTLLSDSLNHASLIDGCRLSRARTVVYPHVDSDALAGALQKITHGRAVIVTDAVFSMDGDVAPLDTIAELAERHDARVVVDEAHATGVVGPGGRGLVAALGLQDHITVTIGTLGKALGSYGAFACCDEETAELLVNRARTMIFSTALPPPSIGAARAALNLLREQPERVDRLHANARILRVALQAPLADMPIVPLIVGGAEDAVRASERALGQGVFVQAIRPPTVPEGTSRLRVVVTAAHTGEEIRRAAGILTA